jgi:hypothetical protein
MQEQWKPVVGYEGLYEVSNFGRVKSYVRYKDGIILNMSINSTGYPRVCLKGKFHNIHLIVAKTFLNYIPKKGYVIDHIDDDKTNNNKNNLQIVTHRYNITKSKKGTSKYTGVCWDKYYNKWKSAIQINGKIKNLGKFDCELKAHLAYQNKLKEIENGK